jgi:hypothetical protein
LAKHRIYTTSFAAVYPHYVAKAEKKGRTKAEVDQIISWLTGYRQKGLEAHLEKQTDFETFFAKAPKPNPSRALIKGGVRCPRGGYQGADHARNPLPGQTDRRAGAGKSDGQDLAKELILSDQPP